MLIMAYRGILFNIHVLCSRRVNLHDKNPTNTLVLSYEKNKIHNRLTQTTYFACIKLIDNLSFF